MNNTIRDWRKANGLTQTQLAERLGVNQSTVAGWETGSRKLSRSAVLVHQVTGIPLEALLIDESDSDAAA